MIPALFSAFAVAVGLAMDAFSVSLAGGTALKNDIAKTALLTALTFGFFQFAMPVIGWLVGGSVSSFLNPFGYWIVVALFFFIGGKMIYDAVTGEEDGVSLIGFKVLILLAVATSIDALAVGISYGLLGEAILLPSVIIGVVAFAFSFAGVLAGHKLSGILGSKMEILGGCILILIGVKFLLDILL